MIDEELKNSILEFAMKGKLSKHHKDDEDIEDYLRIVRNNPYIKLKDVRETLALNIECPNNWKVVKLGSIVGVYGGKRIPAGRKLVDEDTGHKYIRVADMNEYTVELDDIKYVPEDIYETIKRYTISKDDLYITVAGTIGKVGYIPEELDGANLTENANKLVFNNIDQKWLFYALSSPLVQRQIREMTTKVGQPKLAIMRIVNIEIPIPTIEEQRRIVNKIEVLFEKINEIKPICDEIKELKCKFRDDIKRAVLKSACSGNLTKQNNDDSIKLITTIQNDYNIKIQEIKKAPYQIPSNWHWIKFGDLVEFNIGKTPPRNDLKYWNNGKYNWVSISDMNQGEILLETKEMVSEEASAEIFKNRLSKVGTLLMSFKLTIGTCSVLGIDAYHNEGIISIYPRIKEDIHKKYLLRILPFISNLGETKGAIKGSTLNKTSLTNLPIPLPPIEEQKRIVKKIEEILPIIESINSMY